MNIIDIGDNQLINLFEITHVVPHNSGTDVYFTSGLFLRLDYSVAEFRSRIGMESDHPGECLLHVTSLERGAVPFRRVFVDGESL